MFYEHQCDTPPASSLQPECCETLASTGVSSPPPLPVLFSVTAQTDVQVSLLLVFWPSALFEGHYFEGASEK